MPVYLDHAASTPLRSEALEAMLPHLTDDYANPSGAHRAARQARQAIDEARDTVADALGAQPGEVVFTSGGTEADNLAVFGGHGHRPGVVVCSAVEHHAVLHAVESVGGRTVGVDAQGVIDLDVFESELTALSEQEGPPVTLVSVMLANNEVGTIQPLDAVAEIVRARAPGALLHTDAVQAVPWLDVAERAATADLISISAHKFGGPKGAGALVVRPGVELQPMLVGGGQERERRSGTQNVAAIVGMARALELTVDERKVTVDRVAALRDRLADGLVARVPGAVETGVSTGADGRPDRSQKVAGACHVCFEGLERESLLVLLERAEVYVSAGSSCASGAMESSHVLAAMGVPSARAEGAIRFSLGSATTDADVDAALEVVGAAADRLRAFS